MSFLDTGGGAVTMLSNGHVEEWLEQSKHLMSVVLKKLHGAGEIPQQ